MVAVAPPVGLDVLATGTAGEVAAGAVAVLVAVLVGATEGMLDAAGAVAELVGGTPARVVVTAGAGGEVVVGGAVVVVGVVVVGAGLVGLTGGVVITVVVGVGQLPP